MVRILFVLTALLLVAGCEGPQGPKGDTGMQGPPGKTIFIPIPVPGPGPTKAEPEPVQKFEDTWFDIYDSPLSTRQNAYCRSSAFRAGTDTLDSWVVLVNEVPKSIKGKILGVVETQCSVIKTEFPKSVLKEGLKESNALFINGKIQGETLQISSYVRVDRTP